MAVIWTTLEVIFLFFFFELPPVDDFIKSKYDEHLEHDQIHNSGSDNKQNGADKKHDKANQNVEGESLNCDGSVSISEQENTPLLRSDCMNDIQIPETTHRSITPPSQKFTRRAYWLLNG